MKKWIPLLVLFLVGFSNASIASHLLGGEVTYKPTATAGIVEVHLIIFKNCDGGIDLCINACGGACTQIMALYGADPAYTSSNFGSFTVSLVNVRDIKDNQSAGTKNTCTNMNCTTAGSFTPGIERYEFVGYVNIGTTASIPAACCNVRIEWSQNARSGFISTGSANQNLYINAIINRCQYNIKPNASPAYNHDPIAVLCGGENVLYNMGASYDPDGDSLSYAFAPAKQAYNSSVTYNPPWAYDKPMPWSGAFNAEFPGGIRCEPTTGRLLFTPGNASSSNFYGVICIEVKQWKTISGVPTVIGITYRDMQCCLLANCQINNPPRLITYPANPINPNVPRYDWVFPSGVQTCFTMVARDTDYIVPVVSDTTTIETANAFPGLGGIFTRPAPVGSLREDSVRFCWTPTEAQQSSNPYILSIRIHDSRKPMEGKAMYPLKITVPVSPKITSVSDSALSCYGKRFKYTMIAGSPVVVKTNWSVRKLIGNANLFVDSFLNTNVLDYTFADTGLFQVNTFAFGDSASGYAITKGSDTVRISTSSLSIVGTDTTLCKNTAALLSATISGGKTPYLVKWTDNAIQYAGLTRLVNSGTLNKLVLVKVTDSLNCSVTDTVQVKVNVTTVLKIQKIADTLQCENGNVFKLFNNTNDSLYPGITYNWRLDDSIAFSTDTILFSLSTLGTHTLKLLSLTAQGCRDTVQQKLILFSKPKALFVVNDTTQCLVGNSFSCTNQSTNAAGSMTYQWRAGATTSGTTNLTTSLPSSGIQGLRLIVVNSLYNACADTLTKNVYVYPQPTVSNTINSASQCLKGNSFVFTNTSAQDTSIIYQWIIDGDTSAGLVVNKTFTSIGSKNVKLKMTSTYGCHDSLSKTITVAASPASLFSVSDSIKCLRGNQFAFTNQSSITPSGSGLSYLWNMGNAITYSNQNVNYTYGSAGKYTVSLIATNLSATQCKDTVTKVVTVYPQPNLTKTVNNTSQCLSNNQFIITNTSSGLTDTNYTFMWKVEGASKTGTILNERFTTLGSKSVKLFSYTNKGCIDSLSFNVIVNPQPVAQITINDTDQCLKGNSFLFVNSSTGATSGTFVIDGSSPNTGMSVTKAFTSAGVKPVRLVVTNSFNCTDTALRQVEVLYSPQATFTISDSVLCLNDEIVCTNTTNSTAPLQSMWVFTDSTFSNLKTVSRRFPVIGMQKVLLNVITDRGCLDTVSKDVEVYASPITPVISGPTSVLPNSTVTYFVLPNPELNYFWQITNGLITSGQTNSHLVNVTWDSIPSNGLIVMHTQNAQGCNSEIIRYNVSITGGVGLSDVAKSFQNLSVFPNPTTDAVTISFNSMQVQPIKLTLYNIVGTEVKSNSYNAPKGLFNEQINLHDLQKGIYFMRIEGESGSQTVKLLLK